MLDCRALLRGISDNFNRATMIDWKVIVDGEFPRGWNPRTNGCAFPDFDTQEYLLPYFNVGDVPIDEYGGTTFDRAALLRLRAHLEWHIGFFEAKGAAWTVTETSNGRSRTLKLRRRVVLALLDRTIAMIDRAIRLNGALVFLGD